MVSKSARQTKKIAKELIKEIPKNRESAFVIALKGDLGGGKTTFVQGLAEGLGVKEKITSPTFNIYKRYNIPSSKEARPLKKLTLFPPLAGKKPGEVGPLKSFYHLDCYRIERSREILDLGFKEIISDSKNIVAIEWAEKIKDILPKNTQWINFEFLEKETRAIDLNGNFSKIKAHEQ